eukprot:1176274-Prorocentrum_minimum.AAC.4
MAPCHYCDILGHKGAVAYPLGQSGILAAESCRQYNDSVPTGGVAYVITSKALTRWGVRTRSWVFVGWSPPCEEQLHVDWAVPSKHRRAVQGMVAESSLRNPHNDHLLTKSKQSSEQCAHVSLNWSLSLLEMNRAQSRLENLSQATSTHHFHKNRYLFTRVTYVSRTTTLSRKPPSPGEYVVHHQHTRNATPIMPIIWFSTPLEFLGPNVETLRSEGLTSLETSKQNSMVTSSPVSHSGNIDMNVIMRMSFRG